MGPAAGHLNGIRLKIDGPSEDRGTEGKGKWEE